MHIFSLHNIVLLFYWHERKNLGFFSPMFLQNKMRDTLFAYNVSYNELLVIKQTDHSTEVIIQFLLNKTICFFLR